MLGLDLSGDYWVTTAVAGRRAASDKSISGHVMNPFFAG
jgi:hypothetical protein